MMITALDDRECRALVNEIGLGRLGCARDGQPYIVPIYFVAEGAFLYSFATYGQKIEWMRTNPLVCVEIDRISGQSDWETVVAFGRFEELSETPQWEAERRYAWSLLQRRANWWEPAYVRTVIDRVDRPLSPVFFRIHVDRISGHRLTSPSPASGERSGAAATSEDGMLMQFLRGLFGDGRPQR